MSACHAARSPSSALAHSASALSAGGFMREASLGNTASDACTEPKRSDGQKHIAQKVA
jgi:hypothetical protein